MQQASRYAELIAGPWAPWLAQKVDRIHAVAPDETLIRTNVEADAAAEGAPLAGLFPADALPVLLAAHRRALASGAAERVEWGTRGPEGVRSWASTLIVPVRQADLSAALWQTTDRTAEKQTEERLRRSESLMVDTQGVVHLGTWEWDITQPTASWSPELYRIYGETPETYTPSYEGYLRKVHPDDRDRVREATERVFRQHIPYSHDERIYRPDGSLRYLHTWALPVLDPGGKLLRLVGVCQDITDRALAELAVQKLNRELQSLNQELERRVLERTRTLEAAHQDLEAFNASVSHDLRAPLTVIRVVAAELAEEKAKLAPELATRLDEIDLSARRMERLIADLLRLSRVAHGELHRETVDLTALLREIEGGLRRREPGRTVEVSVAEGLLCRGDPGLLRIVLENLLDNAWKYTSKTRAPRIEVGVTQPLGERAFYVRDNGAGFEMKSATNLFAPFQRLHGTREFQGTGVGLATVHRILHRHGGRIWAEGTAGKGATFYFSLPGDLTEERRTG